MDEGRIYVRITGKAISKKELEIYFQSRKQSGGGDISSIEQINDEESIITFEDQEVAKDVALRTHTINGAQVEVSIVPFSGEDSELTSNQSSVVFIRGFSKNTNEDGLRNYLENTRRSGGGPVEELKINGNSARVKFESSGDARNVTLRTHSINRAQVEVSCHPFTEENSESQSIQASVVFIRGLSKDTTEDGLLNYLENTRRSGGGPVEELKITGNSARVKFESSEDARKVTLRTHRVNGALVEVSCNPFTEDSESQSNQLLEK